MTKTTQFNEEAKAWLQDNTALQQKILAAVNGTDFEVLSGAAVAVMHSFVQVVIRCTVNEAKQTYYLMLDEHVFNADLDELCIDTSDIADMLKINIYVEHQRQQDNALKDALQTAMQSSLNAKTDGPATLQDIISEIVASAFLSGYKHGRRTVVQELMYAKSRGKLNMQDLAIADDGQLSIDGTLMPG